MSTQMAFYVDSSVCVGCRTCEISCKDTLNLTIGPRPRYVRDFAGGSWVTDSTDPSLLRPDGVFSYNVSISCNHCANPACKAFCQYDAITKDPENGIVSIDEEKCTGCGACQEACPYGAPQVIESDQLAKKCDFCKDLLDQGQEPACVGSCPMRALDYGDYSELVALYGETADVAPLPSSSETVPSLVIKLHKDAKTDMTEGYTTSLYVMDR